MPDPPQSSEWEEFKPKLWQLWVRDKLPLAILVLRMRDLGLHAEPKQFLARFKTWGFKQKLPSETWKYVESQMRSKKRKVEESDVIISGVYIPPAKVCKEISRHFYNQLERQRDSPSCPPGTLVTVCPASTIPPGTLSFEWGSQMPWLQFNRHFPFPAPLLDSRTDRDTQVMAVNSNSISKTLTQSLKLIGLDLKATPSHLSIQLEAIMPENFQGEHLLYSQSLIEGSNTNASARLAISLCAYLISNHHFPEIQSGAEYDWEMELRCEQYRERDDTILKLIGNLDLMKILGPQTPFLESVTMTVIIQAAFEAALRQRKMNILVWVLELGLDPSTECYSPHSRSTEPSLRFLLGKKRRNMTSDDGIPQLDVDLIKTLLSYGAYVDENTLLSAAYVKDVRVLALLVQSATKTEGSGFLRDLDWMALYLKATQDDRPGADMRTFDYLVGLNATIFPDEIDPLSVLSQPDGLIKLVENPSLGLVKVMIERDVDLNCCNEQGKFPLGAAVDKYRWQDVEWEGVGILLEWGADVNYQPVDSEGRMHPTALHLATLKYMASLAGFLLGEGANPNIQGSHQRRRSSAKQYSSAHFWVLDTPLESAIADAEWGCAEILLGNGATIKEDGLLAIASKGKKNWKAGGLSSISIVKELVERGIDLTKRSSSGETALDISILKGEWEIAMLLLRAGALTDDRGRPMEPTDAFGWSPTEMILYELIEHPYSISDCIAHLRRLAPHDTGDSLLELVAGSNVQIGPSTIQLLPRPLDNIKDDMKTVLDQLPDAYSSQAISVLICLLSAQQRNITSEIWADLIEIIRRISKRRRREKIDPEHQIKILQGATFLDMQANSNLLDIVLPFAQEDILCCNSSLKSPLSDLFNGFRTWHPSRSLILLERFERAGLRLPTWSGLATLGSNDCTVEDVERLIDCGFNPRKRHSWSFTSLRIAVAEQNVRVVKFLIDRGVNINAHSCPLDFSARSNYTVDRDEHTFFRARSASQLAVWLGNLDLINLLFKAGADVNVPPAPRAGGTALQVAVYRGYIGVAKWFINLGADVNAPGSRCYGHTALEWAAEAGRIDAVQLLLDNGCNLHGTGRAQFVRAVKLAERRNRMALASMLKKAGGWNAQDQAIEILWTGCVECEKEIRGDSSDPLLPHGALKHHDGCRLVQEGSIDDTVSELSCSCESEKGSYDDSNNESEPDDSSPISQLEKSSPVLGWIDQTAVENYTEAWLEKLQKADKVVDLTDSEMDLEEGADSQPMVEAQPVAGFQDVVNFQEGGDVQDWMNFQDEVTFNAVVDAQALVDFQDGPNLEEEVEFEDWMDFQDGASFSAVVDPQPVVELQDSVGLQDWEGLHDEIIGEVELNLDDDFSFDDCFTSQEWFNF